MYILFMHMYLICIHIYSIQIIQPLICTHKYIYIQKGYIHNIPLECICICEYILKLNDETE